MNFGNDICELHSLFFQCNNGNVCCIATEIKVMITLYFEVFISLQSYIVYTSY